MERVTFIIRGPDHPARINALKAVKEAPEGTVITLREKVRTSEQNSLLHALISAVAKSGLHFAGSERSVEEWKMIFVSGHSIATGQKTEIIPGIEGEFINVRESTATMGVKRLSSIVEYIQAFAYTHGIEVD